MANVLIVDDQYTSRAILEELVNSIAGDIHTRTFENPLQALEWAAGNQADLILTDYKMPHMNGIELSQALRRLASYGSVPIILITVMEEKLVRYKALREGVTDILYKPVDHQECQARCRNLLALRRAQEILDKRSHWLEKQVAAATRLLYEREHDTLLRLQWLANYRECHAHDRGDARICRYARLIAEGLGLPHAQCENIAIASGLHDIGNIAIADAILNKPGPLVAEERELLLRHTRIGHELLRDCVSPSLELAAVVALGHHERLDGRGYPQGLSGEAIPLPARIAAVADVFDAMTSSRPYRPARSMQQALEYLQGASGTAYDPACVSALLGQLDRVVAIHAGPPAGSSVAGQ